MQAFGGAISHLSEFSPDMEDRYGLVGGRRTGGMPNRPNYTTHQTTQTSTSQVNRGLSSGGIGTLDYNPTQGGYSASYLPGVSDPDKTLSNVARSQHESYIRNFRDFEEALIAARDDTSLIDAAKKDAPEQARIAKEAAERQRSRYGLQQTAVEARETERASKRGEAINLAGGVNNARLAQRDANRRLLGDLINIGQGVNRSSLSQLGTAAENATARKNAYTQAKAQHKAQTWQMVGSLGATALMAAFLL